MSCNQTLRERIVDSLREAIIRGELRPGTRLQEIEIATSYATSRTPVREAFHHLEAEGFVQLRPRRGAFVCSVTEQDIREFYEIRALLEGHAARQAVRYLSPEELSQMEQINQELRRCYQAGEINPMIELHNKFHEIFIAASGNTRLLAVVKNLVTKFQRFRIAVSHTDAILESLKTHDELIAAFRAGDGELAAELAEKNAREGAEAVVKILHQAEESDCKGPRLRARLVLNGRSQSVARPVASV